MSTPEGWRVDFEARPELRTLLELAQSEIGIHENPPRSNRGPEIDRWTGMEGEPSWEPGKRWCAFWLSHVFRDAGFRVPRMGSAAGWIRWAMQHGTIVASSAAVLPGDVWAVEEISDEDGAKHGHVALIVAVGEKFLHTIGGNEPGDGGRVRAWWRERSKATAIVRVVAL